MIDITQDIIISNWKKTNKKQILVSISCITYNHKLYIEKCLDGILMQKTTFPFEILIHDDCSNDGTTEIIKEYEKKFPLILKAIYEVENQYQKGKPIGTMVWNYPRAKGKYIAFCEGDDFWIDKNKLQKQVDFLENNPEYGMCYTRNNVYLQKTERIKLRKQGKKIAGYDDLFLYGNRIATLTVLLRKEILDLYYKDINPADKGWKMGDLPMWLYFYKTSKVKRLPFISATYRVLEVSASHFIDEKKRAEFRQSSFDVRLFFAQKFNNYELLEKYKQLQQFYNFVEKEDIKNIRTQGKIVRKYLSRKKLFIYYSSFCKFLYYLLKKIRSL